MKRNIKYYIFLPIIVVLAGFSIWYFFIGIVPQSYAECLKTHTNDYSRNQLWCSFSPKTPAQQKICEQKRGIINPYSQCLIIYYNPSFVFPTNFSECLEKVGSTNSQTCDVEINIEGSFDEQVTKKLIRDCINASGENLNPQNGSCTKRFELKGS